MPDVRWIPTTAEVYRAIYAQHHEALQVFGTHTCSDGGCEFHSEGYVLTEWGFRDADYPLIRSIAEGNRPTDSCRDPRRWSYFIAQPEEARDAEA